jgi:hypothetical protein
LYFVKYTCCRKVSNKIVGLTEISLYFVSCINLFYDQPFCDEVRFDRESALQCWNEICVTTFSAGTHASFHPNPFSDFGNETCRPTSALCVYFMLFVQIGDVFSWAVIRDVRAEWVTQNKSSVCMMLWFAVTHKGLECPIPRRGVATLRADRSIRALTLRNFTRSPLDRNNQGCFVAERRAVTVIRPAFNFKDLLKTLLWRMDYFQFLCPLSVVSGLRPEGLCATPPHSPHEVKAVWMCGVPAPLWFTVSCHPPGTEWVEQSIGLLREPFKIATLLYSCHLSKKPKDLSMNFLGKVKD